MRFEEFAIPQKVTDATLKYDETIIVPIGDVHYGARGFAERSFKEFIHCVREEYDPEKTWYIGMGDYVDAYRTTVRQAFKNLSEDDGEVLDDYMDEKLQGFFDMVAHTRGRWLGLLKGNHSWEYRTGGTFETRLCEMLEARYLDACADVKLRFDNGDRIRGSVGIWMHHGAGGRKYPVGKLIDDVCPHFPDNDIFLMGHTHVREYRDFIRMQRVGKQYVDRVAVAAITGGWLKGYIEGPSTYIERKPMKPLAVGGLVVKVRPRMVHGIFSPKLRVEMV